MKKKYQIEEDEQPVVSGTSKDSGQRNIYLFGRLENEIALPVVKRLLKFEKDELKFEAHKAVRLITVGIPMALQFSMFCV